MSGRLWLLGILAAVTMSACSGKDDDSDTDVAGTGSDTDTDTDTNTDTGTAPVAAVSNLAWVPDLVQYALITVSWDQAAAGMVQVEFAVDSGEWQSIPARDGVVGANEQLLVGVPYGEDADWRIVDLEGNVLADGLPIVVDDPPRSFPRASNPINDPSKYLPEGRYLLGSTNEDPVGWSGGTYWMWVMDRKGRPVWVQPTPDRNWTLYAQVGVLGDRILYDEQTYWNFGGGDGGRHSTIHSIYLDRPIDSFIADGLHHAFIQMPDESFVWGSKTYIPDSEALLQMSPGDAAANMIWNCRDDWDNVSYCESNCITYSEERDTFLYSFYTTSRNYGRPSSAALELDRSTGTTLWHAGVIGGGLDFDPPSSEFSWQHGLVWTDAGTLLLSTESSLGGGSPDILATEYEVDTKNGVLTELWSNNSTFKADTNGDTHRLSNGNTLHAVGSSGQVIEVDDEKNVVWQLDFGNGRLVGRVEWIEDLYDLVSPEAK